MNTTDLKNIPIVDFLASEGFTPARIRRDGTDFWYISPLRQEKTPSFHVRTDTNTWKDFGDLGKGGDILNLAQRLWGCDFHTAAVRLAVFAGETPIPKSLRPPKPEVQKRQSAGIEVRPLTHPALIDYGEKRGIPPAILKSECCQLHVTPKKGEKYFGIGFQNCKGGWELRNESVKLCHVAKGISVRKKGDNRSCVVVEGFFDYLSFLVLSAISRKRVSHDFIVLNSVSLFGDAIPHLKEYDKVFLCLDNDDAGKVTTQKIREALSCILVDGSSRYRESHDINDYLNFKISRIKKSAVMDNKGKEPDNEQVMKDLVKWAAEYANSGNGYPWLVEKFNVYCEKIGLNQGDRSDVLSHRQLFRERVVIEALHAIHGVDSEDFTRRVQKLDDALKEIAAKKTSHGLRR